MQKAIKGVAGVFGIAACALLAASLALDSWRVFTQDLSANVSWSYEIGLLYQKVTVEAGSTTAERRTSIDCDQTIESLKETCEDYYNAGLTMLSLGAAGAFFLFTGAVLALIGMMKDGLEMIGVGVSGLGAVCALVGMATWGALTSDNYLADSVEWELGTAAILAIVATALGWVSAGAAGVALVKK